MSRCVFLSAGGDVFITSLVIKLWKERWYDEVDKFYVNYNNHAGVPDHAVKELMGNLIDEPKIRILYSPRGIGNGLPITEMTLIAKEDLVMLLEDDGFIFGSGIVNESFQRIEKDQVDAVGSPRGSCGLEVWNAAQKKYNLDYSGYGDVGPNYWPNFFFCKREDLLKTDLNFASKTFKEGEYFKELDHTFEQTNHGDTFVWGCIQLRYNGVRFGSVPQYHASPEEIEYYERHGDKWTPGTDIRWIHGGSLSAGWGGYLSGSTPDTSTIQAKMEIESRVAFWKIALETTEGFHLFRIDYGRGIEALIERAELSTDRIQRKYNIYKNLLRV